MKKALGILGFVLWFFFPAIAQTTKPADGIPAFKILQTNGRYFQSSSLDKNKPVVLIYFAPDCPHCQVLMEGLFKNYSAFKKTQLVLVTFKPVSELQLFEHQFNTAKYANVKTGTEGTTYVLRYYYNINTTPYTAVFNKNHMVCSFRNSDTPISDIINCVKGLK